MSENNNATHNGSERRQYFRVDMKEELIDIIWKDNGTEHQKKITCLDFSRGGVKARCDERIPVNAQATVIFKAAAPNSQRLDGRILRCIEQTCGRFQIALQLNH